MILLHNATSSASAVPHHLPPFTPPNLAPPSTLTQTSLAMSLCHMDLSASGTMMQQSLPSQMFTPAAFEGILELRKEKSRDAARSRRGKENYEFYELAKMLPLPLAITSQLDKASVIRLSISYLKLRDFSRHGHPPWNADASPLSKVDKGGTSRRRNLGSLNTLEMFEAHQGTHILQSLDGFAFALSNDGRFLYISETVSIYLGLSQVEMTGSSFFDYVHYLDQKEAAEVLGIALPHHGASPAASPRSDDEDNSLPTPQPTSPREKGSETSAKSNPQSRSCFCIRMKSTLTKRGVHVKTSGYRVVQILSNARRQVSYTLNQKEDCHRVGIVALAVALPPPTITEFLIDNEMFVMRLSPEFSIMYCEVRVSDMMDIQAEDLCSKSLYSFCHAEDLSKLRKAHIDLMHKGQVLTDYYRLLNHSGGYIWIQTCATVISSAKNADDQNIIAINYILSGIQYAGCIMDANQLHNVTEVCENKQPDQSCTEITKLTDQNCEMLASPVYNIEEESERKTTKRPHSSIDMTPSDDMPSPVNSAIYEPVDKANNFSAEDDTDTNAVPNSFFGEKQRTDAKSSRRKMEKPKKRKVCHSQDLTCVDAPERFTSNISNGIHDEQCSSSPVEVATDGVGSDRTWLVTSTATNNMSSVRGLEEAMNKHLPAAVPADGALSTADFLSYSQHEQQKHKSTIQWIGSQTTSSDQLAATNLLRSLYANRESVIRANVYNSHYADLQASLLTPPGGGEPSRHTSPVYQPGYASGVGLTDAFAPATPPGSVSPHDVSFVDQFQQQGLQQYPLAAHGYERSTRQLYPAYYASTFAAYNAAAAAPPAHYRHTKNSTW